MRFLTSLTAVFPAHKIVPNLSLLNEWILNDDLSHIEPRHHLVQSHHFTIDRFKKNESKEDIEKLA